jgi:hypothetical protein
MANLIRRKQIDQPEFSGFIVEVGDSNYYPLSSNPVGYVNQATLNSATGTLNSIINSVSGDLDTKIQNSGSAANGFSNDISGALSIRLSNTGNSLLGEINSLSGYTVSVSGALNSTILSGSGAVSTKVDVASGFLKSYTDTVSGSLNNQIATGSSAANVNNIASGNNFNFSGTKTFLSPITAQTINISGSTNPTSISIVASSGVVSIVGDNGTFVSYFETGANASLYAVTDSNGLPMIELFDDYTLILGHSSRPSIIISGLSGYVLLPSLPTQTQTGGLPEGTIFRSGKHLMIL